MKKTPKVAASSTAASRAVESASLDQMHMSIQKKTHVDEMYEIPRLKSAIFGLMERARLTPPSAIDQILLIKDKIKCAKRQIKSIEQQRMRYLKNSMPFVFDYFESKQQSVDDGNDVVDNGSGKCASSSKLVAFLGAAAVSNQTRNADSTSVANFYDKSKQNADFLNICADSSVSLYFDSIGEPPRDGEGGDMYSNVVICCTQCNVGEMIEIEEEGYAVCNNSACAKCVRGIICGERSSFKDPPKEVYLYEYQRINHFKEIIAQFQGKETTKIPQQVIDRIALQIKKERICKSTITISEMRDILKRINLSKRYDHAAYIMIQLGVPPPRMSTMLEEKLYSLFGDIQAPYERHCPDTRVNFLNYFYTAYKLCELLDERQYLPHFRMLTDPRKRDEQDEIWKNICRDLNWTFYKTIV